MNALTLTDLNKAIEKLSKSKRAPEGLTDLLVARAYLMGKLSNTPAPKDPRPILDGMGWKR